MPKQLHAITPDTKNRDEIIKKIINIYDVVDYVHLRQKHWRAIDFEYVIEAIKTHDNNLAKLIINNRVDVALLNGIDRVHLPWHSFEPTKIKDYFPSLRYGASVHSMEMAQKQEKARCDYLIFGHIFPTDSKRNCSPQELDTLKNIVETVEVPVIAIGGISPDNVKSTLQTGANGIAIMSGIFNHKNCRQSALLYREKINQFI